MSDEDALWCGDKLCLWIVGIRKEINMNGLKRGATRFRLVGSGLFDAFRLTYEDFYWSRRVFTHHLTLDADKLLFYSSSKRSSHFS